MKAVGKAVGKPARRVRIGMNNPERLVRSTAAEKEDGVPRACDRAWVNLWAARIAQLRSQLRGLVFVERRGEFVALQAIQKLGVHQSLLLRKSVRSPAFRRKSDPDSFRDAKRFRLKAGLRTALIIVSGRRPRPERSQRK